MNTGAAMTADKSSFNSGLNAIAPKWLNTLLVIVIGYALAALTIKMLPAAEINTDQAVRGTSSAVSSRPAVDKMQLSKQIAAAHLFGNVLEAPKEEPVKKQPVVKTKLNLKLTGVAAYEPQEKAIAIINTGGSDEAAFQVGDTIIGQTKLKAVYADRVILDNRGREEVLALPEIVTPIAVRQPAQRQQPRAAAAGGAGGGAPVDNLPTTPGALRDTLAKNPSLLGRVVAAEPYQENGKLKGYRITPKQNPEILESQGIIAGDIITRVNNIELNSQKQGVRALRNAVKAESLEVTILRDGVEIPLSISLAQ